MKFKLLVGMHFENGARYDARDKKNNIIVTELDLAEKFGANKFQRLIDEDSPQRVTKAQDLDKGADVVAPASHVVDVPKPAPVPVPEPDKDELTPDKLVAMHKGRGRWVVIDSRTDKPIHDGTLSKKEAKELAEG